MRRCLVSSFLAAITQQIHSFRASGVIAVQRLFAAASDSMARRKSDGSLCIVPRVIPLVPLRPTECSPMAEPFVCGWETSCAAPRRCLTHAREQRRRATMKPRGTLCSRRCPGAFGAAPHRASGMRNAARRRRRSDRAGGRVELRRVPTRRRPVPARNGARAMTAGNRGQSTVSTSWSARRTVL